MPYFSFFKLRMGIGLQYRVSAWAGLATQFFWGLLLLFLYEAFYKNNIPTPLEWEQLVSYVWLGQAFFSIVFFRWLEPDIYQSLRTGQIAYELVRPLNIYWMWFIRVCAMRISSCILKLVPILLIAILLPSHYALGAPESLMSFFLFLITLILGLIISTALAMLIYILMFYTTSCVGLYNSYATIATFFSGMDLPIVFMPSVVQAICFILPFRLCMDLPMRLYVGNITITEGMQSILIQIAWILALIPLGNFCMKKVGKRLVVQGG